MKFVIFTFCLIFAVVVADVKELKQQVPIINLESNVEHNGNFHYQYESGDGTKANQEGQLKQVDPENAGESVSGQFQYVGDDGQTYSVSYTADENGYIPQGDHIPTPPPVPEAIARALAYLATAKPPQEK
ncbi:endocuticle structural glycoprotein SgAbd-3 [Condylostylus longicornis]|uniref:endocuticle structural glycoprotein SgAbd-3 n=1 Tax=Condylostylus longicornis TaxID=2530218 RepID=UPI00244E5555|nr:endocuticle structural glycoprotein SgAbd-3 [Condylostylus longicornis]